MSIMKLKRLMVFKLIDFLVDLIRIISKSISYCKIEDAADRGYAQDYVCRCRTYISKASNVLEFDGFLKYAQQYNDNVKLAAYSGHKDRWTGSDYYFDIMDGNTLPNEKFDCILATYVLNVITDVHLALENLKRMLSENGILILTIAGPAINARADIGVYSRCGSEQICKQHFRQVFNIKEYGDLNHAIYALNGMGRIKERENLLTRDNITILTGLCCKK